MRRRWEDNMKIESRKFIGVIIKLDDNNCREVEFVIESDMYTVADSAVHCKVIEFRRKGISCIPVVYEREG